MTSVTTAYLARESVGGVFGGVGGKVALDFRRCLALGGGGVEVR